MFNFHGGATISTVSLAPMSLAAVAVLQHSGHIVIAGIFLFISFLSLFFLVASLIRFFINFRKNAKAFYNPECSPHAYDVSL